MKAWLDKQFEGLALESKTMFGKPMWLVNGNMFAQIDKGKFVVRMSPADKDDCIAKVKGVAVYVMFNGKESKDNVSFGEGISDDIKAYIKKGYDYTKKLPPKEKK